MPDWLHAKIAPMLAGASEPFDSDDYLFEIKWDGIRILAFFGPHVRRLQGRKLTDATDRYPEIVQALEKLPGEGILDGEVVVLDEEGRPDFQRVLSREQTGSADAALVKAHEHPAVYMAFDLLYRNGEPLCELPLLERKRRLSELLRNPPSPIVESTYVIGRGRALFHEAEARGLEGIVAKRLEGRYRKGERSNDWLKIKVRRQTDAVVLATVHEPRTGRVRSLVLGAYDRGHLVWLGNVGSGLDQRTLEQLKSELEPLKAAPAPDLDVDAKGRVEWLQPELVARVEYSELTDEGRLRHPVFIGFVRKDPKTCHPPPR